MIRLSLLLLLGCGPDPDPVRTFVGGTEGTTRSMPTHHLTWQVDGEAAVEMDILDEYVHAHTASGAACSPVVLYVSTVHPSGESAQVRLYFPEVPAHRGGHADRRAAAGARDARDVVDLHRRLRVPLAGRLGRLRRDDRKLRSGDVSVAHALVSRAVRSSGSGSGALGDRRERVFVVGDPQLLPIALVLAACVPRVLHPALRFRLG